MSIGEGKERGWIWRQLQQGDKSSCIGWELAAWQQTAMLLKVAQNYSVTQRTDEIVPSEATTVAASIAVPIVLILMGVVIVTIVLVVISRRRAKRKKMSVIFCTSLIFYSPLLCSCLLIVL